MFDISRVGLFSTIHNPVDAMTKLKDNGAFGKLLQFGVESFPIEQWIERDPPSESF